MSSQRNVVAALSYVFGFLTGVVVLMVEPHDKFIKFHAMQSAVSTGSLFVLNILLGLVFSKFGVFSFISTISGILIWIVIFGMCVIGFYKAKQGRVYKFPYFGNWVEKRLG